MKFALYFFLPFTTFVVISWGSSLSYSVSDLSVLRSSSLFAMSLATVSFFVSFPSTSFALDPSQAILAQVAIPQDDFPNEINDIDTSDKPDHDGINTSPRLTNGSLPQFLPLPENMPADRDNLDASQNTQNTTKNSTLHTGTPSKDTKNEVAEKTDPYLFTNQDFFYIPLPLALFYELIRPTNSSDNQNRTVLGLAFKQSSEGQGAEQRPTDGQSRPSGIQMGSFMTRSSEQNIQGKKQKPFTQADVDLAIAELIAEQPARILKRAKSFGEPQLQPGADPVAGRPIFVKYCGDCHGEDGSGPPDAFNNGGKGIGPYGRTKPFLYLKVLPLNRLYAGGSTPQFAERSAFGAHATLPNMTTSAVLPQESWADVQAYVAQFDRPIFPLPN